MAVLTLPTPAADTLAGRVIVITGAAGVLGKVAAKACAASGAKVVLLDKNIPALESVYDEIQAEVPNAQPAIFPLDLLGATPEHYQQLAQTLEEHYGKLDGLLHNAALLEFLEPIACLAPERWFSSLQVNFNAPFLLTRNLLPLLQKSEEASIVFTSDSSARKSQAYWGAYGVSKVALESFARILAQEWQANGKLRSNILIPGPVRTPLRHRAFPAESKKDLPDANSLVKLYVYLFSSQSREMTGETFIFQDEDHVLRSR